jgi:hypothetical protein
VVSPELSELLRSRARVERVIWWGLTVSILIYVGVVYFLQQSTPDSAEALDSALRLALSVGAVVLSVASLAYRRHANSDERIHELFRNEPDLQALVTDPQTKKVNTELLERLQRLTPFEQRIYSMSSTLQTSLIVSLALHEAVALFGFVWGLLSRDVVPTVPFTVVAILLNFLVYPRPELTAERIPRWTPLQ